MTKHKWGPTDSEGHCMECEVCGQYISIYGDESAEEYNAVVNGECLGPKAVWAIQVTAALENKEIQSTMGVSGEEVWLIVPFSTSESLCVSRSETQPGTYEVTIHPDSEGEEPCTERLVLASADEVIQEIERRAGVSPSA